MQQISSKEAIKNYQQNNYNKWCSTGKPDPSLASNRLLNDIYEPVIIPEFKFLRSDKVFTIGSCFARGLENALSADKIEVLSITDIFDKYPLLKEGSTRQGYMNKYNVYSIYYELLWAFENLNLDGKYFVEMTDNVFVDLHTNHTLVPSDFERTLEKRKNLRTLFLKIKDCRLLTITLGLTETWYDTENGVYLNMTPHPIILNKFPGRFELRILNYEENFSILEKIFKLLNKHCDGLDIVITVSPVPMQTTFTNKDVIIANMTTKSTLRTVADAWANIHSNVHYFPGYEIAMLSNQQIIWNKDRRHLKGALAQYIMEVYKKNYLSGYDNWSDKMDRFIKLLY
ncbi:MAG: GSCFA domain-containing protein [Bacteroidota bacterium]|nr:GSCFA domain-containing protein [Bacteroidota bacterium]